MLYLICATVVLVFSAIMSMAGLGAAFIFVPLFFWLGIPLHEAMPTALLLNGISLSVATISFIRSKLVDFKVAIPMVIMAVLLSPLGVYTSQYLSRQWLLLFFTVFLLFAGSMMLFYKPKKMPQVATATEEKDGTDSVSLEVAPASSVYQGVGIGGLAGYLGGLLGVGGGNFIVPFLNWSGFPPKVASATTAFVVVFASFAGFMGHATLGHIDPLLILFTGIASVLGAMIGSWLMKYKLTGPQLKKIIAILLYVMAIKICWDVIQIWNS